MEGHKIPDETEPINKDWFNTGCIPEIPPEYIKEITLEDLERNNK